MILGVSVSTFVTVHVVISLIAIVAGSIVMFGMLGSNRMPALTAVFLSLTILTSATGFAIPPLVTETFLPSHLFGFLSLGLLAVACFALYGKQLSGSWRWIYVLTALISLYLNVFVLVAQAFLKVPALKVMAPTGSEPPFLIAQLVVLAFFLYVGARAAMRFRPPTMVVI